MADISVAFRFFTCVVVALLWAQGGAAAGGDLAAARPNIVVCMADDWSWPHAGVLGDPVVKTPHFDRVASEGMLFNYAFVSTPSCTPSRLSILTGQHHWRLREGDSLGGSLRKEFDVYTDLLGAAGYHVGRYGKGVWPSEHAFRNRDSFGTKYDSFDAFLNARSGNQPFCYWHGGQDPHRPYSLGIGAESGIDVSKVEVPACLPDHETVRSDLADYLWEVQRFDSEVGMILRTLESIGELENTLFVVSSDNGMPFPRCKATLYDQGTRVPLAIRWGTNVRRGYKCDDFVSLCDLAPTFLRAAGLNPTEAMTGSSLLPLFNGNQTERSEAGEDTRGFVLTGVERHVYRYPKRAIRTKEFLYIRNFDPESWESGEIAGEIPVYDFAKTPWPNEPGAFSFAVDPSPTKQFLRLHRDDSEFKALAALVFSPRPDEELYDLSADPAQLDNVVDQRRFSATLRQLRQQLDAELIKSNDPRVAVSGYLSREIEGWPIRISEHLLEQEPEKTRRAMVLLAEQLRIVKERLPESALRLVINVPIWFSTPYAGFGPTGEYHPGADWLRNQGRHPKLHRCIEFTNTAIFDQEIVRMPVLVLHELAHAYHDQVIGFDNAEIRATYEIAKNNGSYDSVRRGNGRMERAYAITNDREYFAETSEAYFGRNDFYPFDRDELQQHDPRMAELLERLWENPPAPKGRKD